MTVAVSLQTGLHLSAEESDRAKLDHRAAWARHISCQQEVRICCRLSCSESPVWLNISVALSHSTFFLDVILAHTVAIMQLQCIGRWSVMFSTHIISSWSYHSNWVSWPCLSSLACTDSRCWNERNEIFVANFLGFWGQRVRFHFFFFFNTQKVNILAWLYIFWAINRQSPSRGPSKK